MFILYYIILMVCFFCSEEILPKDTLNTGSKQLNSTEIITHLDGNNLNIKGSFHNDADAVKVIGYKLTVSKTGISGTSRTSQSGEHTVESGGTIVVSETTVSINPEDEIEIKLTITDKGEIITEKKITCKGKDFNQN